MVRERSATLRRWMAWAMLGVIVVSIAVWFGTRDTLPAEIRIATAMQGGLYREFAEKLGTHLERLTNHAVAVATSQGSVDNKTQLRNRQVHLAIVQDGSVSLDELFVVAPLYPDVVHLIVRRGRNIRSIEDLAGKRVVLGVPGSGMPESALAILRHYEVDVDVESNASQSHFTALLDDPALDAAIVTTGTQNSDLHRLLADGAFELLGIRDARAIEMTFAHFKQVSVPRGLYARRPPVPAEPLATVATMASIVTHEAVPAALVRRVLEVLYEGDLRRAFPNLLSRRQAVESGPLRLHPVAQRYLYPNDDLGHMANIMESLAATKELLFALGAGMYLLWDRWRRLKERESRQQIQAQKDYLDKFLEQTLRIERAQMGTTDPVQLRAFLDEVTRIKLHALRELTHEELRGDQTFAIFLMQCANLINKIQLKVIAREPGPRP